MRVLENSILKVSVADRGAELSSVYDKETGAERLWDANPSVWNRHAPILFPFVGKVNGGVYRIDGKEYSMKTQHGFARDMEFECVSESVTSVTHRLVATEKTKEIYPYDFELLVTHELDAENPRMLHVKWDVKNNGTEEMYYSIGAHPAFTLPIVNANEKEEYYLEFIGNQDLTYCACSPVNGLATIQEKKKVPVQDGFVKFYDDIYDTLIFDYQNIDKVRIAKPDKSPYVTVTCPKFPFLGIWTKKEANFICLEPWVGRTDDDGFTGTLKEKTGEQVLAAGGRASVEHTIEFH